MIELYLYLMILSSYLLLELYLMLELFISFLHFNILRC
jgi:hypothetical protein